MNQSNGDKMPKHINEEGSERIFLSFLQGNGVAVRTAEEIGVCSSTVKIHTANVARRLLRDRDEDPIIINNKSYERVEVLTSSKLMYKMRERLLEYFYNRKKSGNNGPTSSSDTGIRKTAKKKKNTETIAQKDEPKQPTPVNEKEDGPVNSVEEDSVEGIFEVRIRVSDSLLNRASKLLVALN